MRFSRTGEYEYYPEYSPVFDSYSRRMQHIVRDDRSSVESYVQSMMSRAGFNEYIQIINSQLDDSNAKKTAQEEEMEEGKASPQTVQVTSLIDIQEIKAAIDKAIDNSRAYSYVALIAELEKLVKNDERIPEELKDAMGDKRLRDYINQRLHPEPDKIEYELGRNESKEMKPEDNMEAFPFSKIEKG